MTSAIRKVDNAPAVGQPIRARFLQQLERGVNQSIDALAAPRPIVKESSPNQDGSAAVAADRVYDEVNRVTSTVRIEDPNDSSVYVDVDRIDEITFVDKSSGETVLFRFENS